MSKQSIFSSSRQIETDRLMAGKLEDNNCRVIETSKGPVELIPFRKFKRITHSTGNWGPIRVYLNSETVDGQLIHNFIGISDGLASIASFENNFQFKEWEYLPFSVFDVRPVTADGHMIKIGDSLYYRCPTCRPHDCPRPVTVKVYFTYQWVLIATSLDEETGYTIVSSKYLFKKW